MQKTTPETTRAKRIYLRLTDDASKQNIFRVGKRIGTIVRASDRLGDFWAWNVFFNGRFGGSAQMSVRHASLEEALASARAWVNDQVREAVQP